MEIILRARGGGKTTEACEWLLEKPLERIMVVSNWKIKRDLIREKGLPNNRVFTVDEIRERGLKGYGNPQVLVEDADFLLMRYLDLNIDMATMTGKVVKPKPRSSR